MGITQPLDVLEEITEFVEDTLNELELQSHVELPHEIEIEFGDTGTVVSVSREFDWDNLADEDIEQIIFGFLNEQNDKKPVNYDRLPYDPREGF
jgi:hypothetical protein